MLWSDLTNVPLSSWTSNSLSALTFTTKRKPMQRHYYRGWLIILFDGVTSGLTGLIIRFDRALKMYTTWLGKAWHVPRCSTCHALPWCSTCHALIILLDVTWCSKAWHVLHRGKAWHVRLGWRLLSWRQLELHYVTFKMSINMKVMCHFMTAFSGSNEAKWTCWQLIVFGLDCYQWTRDIKAFLV